jgi:hypothetical protein
MPYSSDSAAGSDPALARRRFPRVVARVIAIQIATLIGLWLLNFAFGAP